MDEVLKDEGFEVTSSLTTEPIDSNSKNGTEIQLIK
jgi:hypothetical protein